nr:MAG TPA: hypothetical protein [Caudoviricetes sp.]
MYIAFYLTSPYTPFTRYCNTLFFIRKEGFYGASTFNCW